MPYTYSLLLIWLGEAFASGPVTLSFGLQDPSQSGGVDNTMYACASDQELRWEVGDADEHPWTPAPMVTDGCPYPSAKNPSRAVSYGLRNTPDLPSFGGHLLYDAPGGHQLFLGAEVQQNQVDRDAQGWRWDVDDDAGLMPEDGNKYWGNRSKVGWVVAAGGNVNVGDIFTLTTSFAYSEGLTSRITGAGADMWGQISWRVEDEPPCGLNDNECSVHEHARQRIVQNKAFGGYLGGSFDITDTTSFNVQYGIMQRADRAANGGAGGGWNRLQTLHANIIWQPVRQMRLGLEGMWGQKRNSTNFIKGVEQFGNDEEDLGDYEVPPPVSNLNGAGQCGDLLTTEDNAGNDTRAYNFPCRSRTEDAFRLQFGAWFFF